MTLSLAAEGVRLANFEGDLAVEVLMRVIRDWGWTPIGGEPTIYEDSFAGPVRSHNGVPRNIKEP